MAPVLRSCAKSRASWIELLPVITAVPPLISLCTVGAETSSPPTKIAMRLPIFLPVSSWNSLAPSVSNIICTTGMLVTGSSETAAVRKCVPSKAVSFQPVGSYEKNNVRNLRACSMERTSPFCRRETIAVPRLALSGPVMVSSSYETVSACTEGAESARMMW